LENGKNVPAYKLLYILLGDGKLHFSLLSLRDFGAVDDVDLLVAQLLEGEGLLLPLEVIAQLSANRIKIGIEVVDLSVHENLQEK
jgi:hypothetical protein